jgi:hypothetical protein
MAENFINRKPQLRGTAAAWTSNNTVLLAGELGIETDTNKFKIGDGVTAWDDLPYFDGGIQNIQEVLTEGNEIDNNQPIVFRGTFKNADIININGELNIKARGGLAISDDLGIEEVKVSADSVGVYATKDYSAFSLGSPSEDEKIYAQRKYVDDATTETATYNSANAGTTDIDCDTFGSTYRILTANTNFVFSNVPATGKSFVKTLEVIGAFSVSFPQANKIIGTYVDDGTTVNFITINFADYPTIGLRITVMINQ